MPKPTPVRARARGALEVRLLDLSLSGARIEHLGLLRPGASCELEFPAALSPLIVSGRVVRSAVVGDVQRPAGDRQLRYETGLVFVDMTPDQQVVLTRILEWIALGGSTEGILTMS
jgi:PilZ domain-containing protein